MQVAFTGEWGRLGGEGTGALELGTGLASAALVPFRSAHRRLRETDTCSLKLWSHADLLLRKKRNTRIEKPQPFLNKKSLICRTGAFEGTLFNLRSSTNMY